MPVHRCARLLLAYFCASNYQKAQHFDESTSSGHYAELYSAEREDTYITIPGNRSEWLPASQQPLFSNPTQQNSNIRSWLYLRGATVLFPIQCDHRRSTVIHNDVGVNTQVKLSHHSRSSCATADQPNPTPRKDEDQITRRPSSFLLAEHLLVDIETNSPTDRRSKSWSRSLNTCREKQPRHRHGKGEVKRPPTRDPMAPNDMGSSSFPHGPCGLVSRSKRKNRTPSAIGNSLSLLSPINELIILVLLPSPWIQHPQPLWSIIVTNTTSRSATADVCVCGKGVRGVG